MTMNSPLIWAAAFVICAVAVCLVIIVAVEGYSIWQRIKDKRNDRT